MNIIIASTDTRRFIAALELALTSAALGKAPRLFLQGEAAALVALPLTAACDERRCAVGMPTLAQILEDVTEAGISLTVCQSGLLMAGLTPDQLWPDAQIGGLISFLAGPGSGQNPVIY
jgi:predicted peroxiredoxin